MGTTRIPGTPAKHHPYYKIWIQMRHRCMTPSHKEFVRYGARGIYVCKEWEDFWVFAADMGDKPSPRHSLDRIDNNGPYAPWNCRWATPKEQTANSRVPRLIEFNGETLNIKQWAQKLGVKPPTISKRILRHGPVGAVAMGGKRF